MPSNEPAKPIYVIVVDDKAKEISISAFPFDSPEYENNHIIVKECGGHRSSAETSARILRNVLAATNNPVVLE